MHFALVHGEVHALDDLGAVLERDVQILQLQQSQLVTPSFKEPPRRARRLVTPLV
jgi:thioesterase domain-containing protein